MKKQYKLLIETAEWPKGTIAKQVHNTASIYEVSLDGISYASQFFAQQVENRPAVWELITKEPAEEKVENEYLPFFPEENEDCWAVNVRGVVEEYKNCATFYGKKHASQGVFRTKESAEYEALRRESMVERYKPKPNEEFWEVSLHNGTLSWDYWKTHEHYNAYMIGNVHRSEEEAKQWADKYLKAWEVLL